MENDMYEKKKLLIGSNNIARFDLKTQADVITER